MKVSLIICAHNEEKYIADCIRSVLWEHELYEIIVVDNASTDKTAEIANYYRPMVKVVSQPIKGLLHARQKGFEESSGDVLAFIDADCRVPMGWVNRIKSGLDSHWAIMDNVVCISGPSTFYDASKFQNFLCDWFWWKTAAHLIYKIVGYMVYGANFAIRRDVLEKMGGFDTALDFYGEDTDIAKRAAEFGKVVFDFDLVMPTSARRINNQGLIKTSFLYSINYLKVVFKMQPTMVHKDYR
jgi:glycosyltransferase involved in cell wall biosynthesis